MIYVIDGPAGSGKSSTAKAVSKKLNINFLDSGAYYRLFTLAWLRIGSQKEFFDSLNEIDVRISYKNGVFSAYLDDEDVTETIRSVEVTSHVSQVAIQGKVRDEVNKRMRKLVQNGEYIADGRDLGTVVFPDADLKIYMKASPKIRAKRRYEELKDMGNDLNYNDILANINERDKIDSNRDIAPLKKADDAIEINTDNLKFSEQVDLIVSFIQKLKQKNSNT